MTGYRITASSFNPLGNNPSVPDAYVDPAVLNQHGVFTTTAPVSTVAVMPPLPNHGKYQKDNNIKPGTDAWFKLWFS